MSDLAQLRESEERYALAMRAMNEAVYDYDVASDQIYYSERIYDVLDVPREFLRTAKDWRTLIHSDDVARYLETFAAHIKRRTERFECDYRYRARGDVWHWARQHGIALRDAAGRAVRVVGSIGDITQLKHTEEALRQSQERYDFAMQAINEGVYDWDIVNDAVYYSERVQRAIGLSPELLSTAKDWRDRIHPDDLPRFDSAMVAHFKQQTERFECDYRYRALDGNWRWARTHGLALRDGRGRAVRMIGSTGDITELKRTEEALRHSEERYALATAVATEGIYEWNVADGSLFLSDRARAFFAVPDGQLDARAWNASVHPEDFSAYRQAVLDHFKGRSDRLEHEYRIANANGEYRWVVDRAIAVRDAKGRVTRLIGALTDMTRRKLAEMELRRAREQAEAASREKSRFLANMSHELRTPLNAIIGFSEVLAERMFGEVNEKQAEYVKDIHESGRHLLSLINDILDLSKIEAGRMELELSTFDLPSALSNAMTLVRERAQRHGIELGLDVDKRLGGFQADERKVKQILLNLLSNAVKFTPDGGRIDVSAKFNASKVEIAVKDTGIGISPEDQPRMFEEFKQVGNDATHKAEGTGLGLALTRRFVELHGGEIRLASVPGKGSTFTITLPVRQ